MAYPKNCPKCGRPMHSFWCLHCGYMVNGEVITKESKNPSASDLEIYLGDRFEEWVVKNSNISKDGYSDLCDKKIFWRLLDWRGDKYIEGYRPLSSSSPDLLMECVTTTSTIHEVGDIIAVECKWRSKIGFYLDIKDIEKYEGYMNSNLLNRPIKNLFYVFGFGWCGDSPESVYVVPARELYDYDKDTCRITFPIKETEKEKMGRLERFKKKDNRCLLYIK